MNKKYQLKKDLDSIVNADTQRKLDNQTRLSLPQNQKINNFATEEDKQSQKNQSRHTFLLENTGVLLSTPDNNDNH